MAMFTHLLIVLYKNQNLQYSFKATTTLQTRISYIL